MRVATVFVVKTTKMYIRIDIQTNASPAITLALILTHHMTFDPGAAWPCHELYLYRVCNRWIFEIFLLCI